MEDVTTVRVFARASDETAICTFRHLFGTACADAGVFFLVRDHLKKHDLVVRKGTMVGTTIISAPSSTKNKSGGRDIEIGIHEKGQPVVL